MTVTSANLLIPDGLPPGITAGFTTRDGGGSRGVYATLNLGDRVGDDPAAVRHNRGLLEEYAGVPVAFMRQVHGTRVEIVTRCPAEAPEADGLVTGANGLGVAVLTADCLPLLLWTADGCAVAAVHCGWRGLADGIVPAALASLRRLSAAPVGAYMGPAIGPASYQVGAEFRQRFVSRRPEAAAAFTRRGPREYADLYVLCRQELAACGVTAVAGGTEDTYARPERFFSYRRDGVTGRMAGFIVKRGGP